jgi:monofunctional biosynthetic peptidoglycan transglycosylase
MARSPAIPRYKRRRSGGSLPRRIVLGVLKLILALLLISILWVGLYRFINPPITATMLGDVFAGRGAKREWLPIDRIDRDMVRAAIAAEDSKYCRHNGFDYDAIEAAMQRNASGGRIRGGSTISQQTAKNAFLWQGGGYARKGVEAWFTFLIEQLWGKRRIMEVYLNIAETGLGTYGVNAGSERYFGHDAAAMSASEAARIAAILPLPKQRGAVSPKGFTRRYGNSISARIGVVARDRLDRCVYAGTVAPENRTAPPSRKPATMPGAEYESARPLPPVETVTRELPIAEEPIEVPAEADPEPAPSTSPESEGDALGEAPPPPPSSAEQTNSL